MRLIVVLRNQIFRITGIFLLSATYTAYAQPLILNPITYSDSTVWYVRNNTADTLYPTSISFKVHHMLQTVAMLPIQAGPGFFNNTEKTTIKGKNYTWKYATSFGCSLVDTLFPGGSIPFAISVNYNNVAKDTVLPANVTLFTNRPVFKEWPVVPTGASCDYKRIFITSRWTQQGIHYYSSISPSLNPNVCQSISSGAAVANAFNPYSMQQTPSRVVPKCPGSRLWTSFGFPKDSVLFYSFNASDGKHLDSIIEGLDSGDYFAYASWPFVNATDLYAQSKTWAKIGLDVNSIPAWTAGQFCFLGRKGLAKGKAFYSYVKVSGSQVSVTADYVMIREQGFDELKPYPDCFEDLAIEHQPYVPEVVKNGLKDFNRLVSVSPNPSAEGVWQVRNNVNDGFYKLFDSKGNHISEGLTKKNELFLLSQGDVSPGMYQLVIYTKAGQTAAVKLIKL
jgi:hypothetical protein